MMRAPTERKSVKWPNTNLENWANSINWFINNKETRVIDHDNKWCDHISIDESRAGQPNGRESNTEKEEEKK